MTDESVPTAELPRRAARLVEQGQWAEAAAVYDEIARRLPQDASAQLRAMAYWRQVGDLEQGADAAERAMQCASLAEAGRRLALELMVASGRQDAAAAAALRLLAEGPADRTNIRALLERLRTANGSWAEARRVLGLRRTEFSDEDLAFLARQFADAPEAQAAFYDEIAQRAPQDPAALRAMRYWRAAGDRDHGARAAERAQACAALDEPGRRIALELLTDAGRWDLVAAIALENLRTEALHRPRLRSIFAALESAGRGLADAGLILRDRRAEIASEDLAFVARQLTQVPDAAAALYDEIARRDPQDGGAQLKAMREWLALGELDAAATLAETAALDGVLDGDGRAFAAKVLRLAERSGRTREAANRRNPQEARQGPASGVEERYRAYVGPEPEYDLMGATQFRLLASLGLRSGHKLLDLGCGSLRAGRLLIPYLEPGNYHGIEPNAWLVEEGVKQQLGRDAIEIKQPRFDTNDRFDCSVFGERFDFIVAQSIFSHTGLALFRAGLASAAGALAPRGLILATFSEGPRNFPRGRDAEGWVYPGCCWYEREEVSELCAEAGLHFRFIPWKHPRQVWFLAAAAPEDLPDPAFDAHLSGYTWGVDYVRSPRRSDAMRLLLGSGVDEI